MQQHLPLLFSFKQVVLGNGFLVGVTMNGRALLDEDSEETWITGVAPVGLAGGGVDRTAAFTDFRKAWAEVLFDIANESITFDAFQRQCEEFLASSMDSMTTEWQAALEEVRRTKYVDRLLRRESADQNVTFKVVDLSALEYGAKENEVEAGLNAAA